MLIRIALIGAAVLFGTTLVSTAYAQNQPYLPYQPRPEYSPYYQGRYQGRYQAPASNQATPVPPSRYYNPYTSGLGPAPQGGSGN